MRCYKPDKVNSVNLIDESLDSQLFSTKKLIRGKIHQKFKIVLKGEHQFSLEKANNLDNAEFIRRTRTNKLVGLIKNGEIEKSERVEKLFFFSKLDLIPTKTNRTNPSHSSSTDDDDSYITTSSNFSSPSPMSTE